MTDQPKKAYKVDFIDNRALAISSAADGEIIISDQITNETLLQTSVDELQQIIGFFKKQWIVPLRQEMAKQLGISLEMYEKWLGVR